MCGIVGYIGQQGAAGILVNGLRSLEYRVKDRHQGRDIDAEDGHAEVVRQPIC